MLETYISLVTLVRVLTVHQISRQRRLDDV